MKSYSGMSLDEIGRRIRVLRESHGLTQSSVADAMQIARTTLVSIEQGKRPINHSELMELAKLFDTTVNGIVRESAVQVDLVPRFREIDSDNEECANAAWILNSLVASEVELENLLGVAREQHYPPERPLLRYGNVALQAEEDAIHLRRQLGLGDAPIQNIVALMEWDLGMRVYEYPLSSDISGLFAFEPTVGACVLINSNHRRNARNTFTAAHELGHFVATRSSPDIYDPDRHYPGIAQKSERYANVFASAFLMPRRSLSTKFEDFLAGSTKLTRRHVILLADYFRVSNEALVRRLEQLELIPRKSWDWFKANGGFDHEEVKRFKSSNDDTQREEQIEERRPVRLRLLAASALNHELLSEGQLSQLLKMDRISLRKWIDLPEISPTVGIEIHEPAG